MPHSPFLMHSRSLWLYNGWAHAGNDSPVAPFNWWQLSVLQLRNAKQQPQSGSKPSLLRVLIAHGVSAEGLQAHTVEALRPMWDATI